MDFKRTLYLLLLLPVWQTAPALAQGVGYSSNASIRHLQTHVNELYERGEYRRAFLIYRDELAAGGDKYAQYMVGYMLLLGQGITADAVHASAWYRLAAERNTREFVLVRDQLMQDLDAVETGQSDLLYLELRKRHGDAVLLLELLRNDLEDLQASTGSRLAVGRGPMTVLDRRTGRTISAADYYRRIEKRAEKRLKMLYELVGLEDVSPDADGVEFDELKALVDTRLQRLP